MKNYKIAIVIIYNFFLLAKKNKAKKYTNYKFFNLPKYYLELLNASILLQCHLATNSLFISKYYILYVDYVIIIELEVYWLTWH